LVFEQFGAVVVGDVWFWYVLLIQRHIYIFTLVRPFSFAAQPCQIPYVFHMFTVIQDPLLA
jgi:hypothetical protein